jgi:ribA/ribD-fused uncharacterized protein
MTMDAVIHFCAVEGPYGYMSNFAPYPIKLDGRSWPTTEHYFQAQKFAGTGYEEDIRRARTPMIAARLGRDDSMPIRSDWEQVKDDIMLEAVRAKFAQHSELLHQLLKTGSARIVEHTAKDTYWGDGGDGTGKNMLGCILMQVRDELRDAEIPRWVSGDGIVMAEGG